MKRRDNVEERFTVQEVFPSSPVDAQSLLDRFEGTNEHHSDRVEVEVFNAVVPLLSAPDGQLLCPGGQGQGICPIHGSGKNPKQAKFQPAHACVICYSDCRKGQETGHAIRLEEILRKHVLVDCASYRGTTAPLRPRVAITSSKPHHVLNRELASAMASTGRLFHYSGEVLVEERGALQLVDTDRYMLSLLHDLIDVGTFKGKQFEFRKIPVTDAGYFLRSADLKACFPEIVLRAAVPVFGTDWTLSQPGYNAASKIFYEGEAIAPAATSPALDALLKEIRFKRPSDRAAYLAILLTPFLGLHVRGNRPIAAFEGNRPGIGKTTAAVCASLVMSPQVRSCMQFSSEEAEMEKRLATFLRSGAGAIVIDNIKCEHISSASLESLTSTSEYAFRLLGTNDLITGPNDVQVMLTFNNTNVGRDLAERSLFVRLEYLEDPKKAPSPKTGDLEPFVREHLKVIRAELLGMIQRWVERGRPMTRGLNFRFQKWAQMVGGILEVAGIPGFLQNQEADASAMDPDAASLFLLCQAHPNERLRAGQWVKLAQQRGAFIRELAGRDGQSAATVLGRVLKQHVDDQITDPEETGQAFVLKHKENGKSVLYWFEPVPEPATSVTTGPSEGSDFTSVSPAMTCDKNFADPEPAEPTLTTLKEKEVEGNPLALIAHPSLLSKLDNMFEGSAPRRASEAKPHSRAENAVSNACDPQNLKVGGEMPKLAAVGEKVSR